MKNGPAGRPLICVSVCGIDLDELVTKLRRASADAGLVEVRFDCLSPDVFDPCDTEKRERVFVAVQKNVPEGTQVVATFRPRSEGGRSDRAFAERVEFWKSADPAWYADLEEDMAAQVPTGRFSQRIVSFHDFGQPAPNVEDVFDRIISRCAPDVVKIAFQAADISDTIAAWRLLEKARGVGICPIAMGEAGKWTRILGPAYGAFMTYASLRDGDETAPGQISATDLREVYRVRELGRQTDVYGIVAGDTSYSVSPYMHNAAFRAAGIDAVFVPLQTADLEAFITRLARPSTREIDIPLRGFSVTNPHKQTIIPFLDDIDPAARAIGAVNTVRVAGDRLLGFNTDADGFIEPLRRVMGNIAGASAAVIGAGGAARACVYALKQEGALVTVLARDPKKAGVSIGRELKVDVAKLQNGPLGCDVVVNATPLGTAGSKLDATPADAKMLEGVKIAYDLTYNPAETRFLEEAKLAGAGTLGGLEMLIGQGVRQFEIWTGLSAPANEMSAAVRGRLRNTR